MSFESKKVTVTHCSVTNPINYIENVEALLKQFQVLAALPLDKVTQDENIGWTVGGQPLNTEINETTAIKGGHIYLSYRTAQRKPAAALLKAACRAEEEVYKLNSGNSAVPKKVKKEIKDRVTEELAKATAPTITEIPVVFTSDFQLLIGTTSMNAVGNVCSLFVATTGLVALPTTPGSLCIKAGMTEDQILPLHPVKDPMDGNQPYLGREFALMHYYNVPEAENGLSMQTVGPLIFAFKEGASERITVDKTARAYCKEVISALAQGKSIVQAGLMLGDAAQAWEGIIETDTFGIKNLELPVEPQPGVDEHGQFADRIEAVCQFFDHLHMLFGLYLHRMAQQAYAEHANRVLQAWVDYSKDKSSEI
jgi:hypothetical protein